MASTPASLREWLAAHPPPDARFTQTVAGVADRVAGGEPLLPACWELLDEVSLTATDDQRRRAIDAEPASTGDPRADAFLAALAEHLALGWGLAVPAWALGPGRALEQFWFVSDVAGFRAIAIAQSPAAFRRRGIFITGGALERV